MTPLRVGDLVSIAAIRPVVRLADLRHPERAADLATAFVLTEDAAHTLGAIFADIRAGRGRGYFLEGHYGSGKSHLLAVLQGLLRGDWDPAALGRLLTPSAAARRPRPDLTMSGRPPLPIPISLIEHAGREPLEAIVRAAVADAGHSLPGEASRRAAFEALAARVQAAGHPGLVLCVDEVTEFLRAKPDARAFIEDVRFLQFLGEWAEGAPAWILLGMQEAIEAAGDLPAPVFGGLRDRYPVRFRLGVGHVRELITGRLVRRLPGAEEALVAVAAGLRATFGEVAGGLGALLDLYPVHPLTVDLLDRLRPLFSERRGVLDFVASRLRGDPARRIPAWLDRPADRLLGPDALVDHFRDRVRERPETAPLVTVALEHFERDLGRLFPDADTAAAALRLAKVILAGALCPTPVGFTAAELTGALLHRLTDLDPALNLEFIAGIAERLANDGAYVRGDPPAAAAGPAGRRYFCDLRVDLAPVLSGRLEGWRSALGPGDGRIWSALLPWCDDPSLPLQRLTAAPAGVWDLTWRRTARQAAVWVVDVESLDPKALREAARALEVDEPDALVLLAAGTPGDPEPLRRAWRDRLIGAAVALHPEGPVLLWLPRAPTVSEGVGLRDAAAHALLTAEVAEDGTATGRRLLRHLRSTEAERRTRTAALFRDLYLEGEVHDTAGQVARPAELGSVPFSALLEHLLDLPLRRRFPLMPELPARPDSLLPSSATPALDRFLRAGPAAGDADVALLVARVLLPLGLCARDARGAHLTDDPDASVHAVQLAAALVGRTPADPAPLPAVYLRLRKGPSGLPRPLFAWLVLTLIRAGAISAVGAGRRLPPDQVSLDRLWQSDGLCPGALIAPHLRVAAAAVPFLPAQARGRTWTHALQREVWDAACAWRRRWRERLPAARAELARAREYPALRALLVDERASDLDRLEVLLGAVAVSLSPHDGLTALLGACAAEPGAALAAERAEALETFLRERLDAFLQMTAYLEAEALVPPAALVQGAADLRVRLRDTETAFGAGFAQVREAFAGLRQAYADAYASAHAAHVGPAAFAACAAVGRGAAYRLACLVGGATAEALTASLGETLAVRCNVEPGALRDRLLRWPACTCGFRPDRPPVVKSAADLRALAGAAASAALGRLQGPECSERLRACPGVDAAALAALSGQAEDAPGRALVYLGAIGSPALRQALAGARSPDLDPAGLASALGGRAWTGQALLAAVGVWMGGVGPEAIVRVATAPGRADGSPHLGACIARAEEALAALRAAALRPPVAPGEWEALWSGPAGAWARRLEEAADVQRGHRDGPPLARWRIDGWEWADRLELAFRAALSAWSASGGWAREGLAPVGRILDAAAAAGGAGRTFAFCVDALRGDLLEAVLDLVAACGLPLRVAARGVAWAVAPTLTGSQFLAWAGAGWSVEIVRQDHAAAEAIAADGRPALDRVGWSEGRRCVCKWDFLDARLHAADDEYGMFAAEFGLRARRLLLPALRALGPGDRVVLFADHGFRARRAPGQGGLGPWRYEHGGDSLDEVLAPYCLLESR